MERGNTPPPTVKIPPPPSTGVPAGEPTAVASSPPHPAQTTAPRASGVQPKKRPCPPGSEMPDPPCFYIL
jgi:hypothetical protein